MIRKLRGPKCLVVFASLVLFVFTLNAAAAPVDARFSSCSSDPIVYLSDGTVLTVYVDIGTDVVNVKEVDYSIHAPKNAKLLYVVHTPFPGFLGKEKFEFHDDGKPSQYRTETKINTTVKNVSIVATSTFGARNWIVNGLAGKTLTASWSTVVTP